MSNKEVVDARRLLCPMPVIRAQDRVATLSPGALVEVICTDPGAMHDIPAWCRLNGHNVESMVEQDREYIITLTVGDDV